MNSSQTLPFATADALKTTEVAAESFLGGASSAASFNVEHELAARLALNHGGTGGGGRRIKNTRINDNSDTPNSASDEENDLNSLNVNEKNQISLKGSKLRFHEIEPSTLSQLSSENNESAETNSIMRCFNLSISKTESLTISDTAKNKTPDSP